MNGSDDQKPASSVPGTSSGRSSPRPTARNTASAPAVNWERSSRERSDVPSRNLDSELGERLALRRERIDDLAVGRDRRANCAADFVVLVEDDDVESLCRKLAGARETRRARADDRDTAAARGSRAAQRLVRSPGCVGRVPLQCGDRDRLVPFVLQHAGALAKHFDRADARARPGEQVLAVDRAGGGQRVAGGQLANEARNVDVCRTRGRARRRCPWPAAVEAAVGLEQRLRRSERRAKLGEVLENCHERSVAAPALHPIRANPDRGWS